jgi:hypothetical protein
MEFSFDSFVIPEIVSARLHGVTLLPCMLSVVHDTCVWKKGREREREREENKKNNGGLRFCLMSHNYRTPQQYEFH